MSARVIKESNELPKRDAEEPKYEDLKTEGGIKRQATGNLDQ